MVTGFDPDTIKDLEGARAAISYLLNAVEAMKVQVDQLRAENQRLRDENNRLKGEQGQPQLKANKKEQPPSHYSSEKERHQPKGRSKKSKLAQIKIDREQVLEVPPDSLPADAEFKGYEEVVVQDIRIKTDNVRFRKKKYYSPAEGKTYLAPLPLGYEGQFGPMIKAWIIVWYFAMTMTEPKIVAFLEAIGIFISAGQVSEIIHRQTGKLHREKQDIYEAGLHSTPGQQIDDTHLRGERAELLYPRGV